MANERILAVGKIEDGGDVQWHISPLVEEPQDGLLQATIDEAEQTAEYEDYLADLDWLRTGC